MTSQIPNDHLIYARRQTVALESISKSLEVIAKSFTPAPPPKDEPKVDFNVSELSGLIGPLGKLLSEAVISKRTFDRR